MPLVRVALRAAAGALPPPSPPPPRWPPAAAAPDAVLAVAAWWAAGVAAAIVATAAAVRLRRVCASLLWRVPEYCRTAPLAARPAAWSEPPPMQATLAEAAAAGTYAV